MTPETSQVNWTATYIVMAIVILGSIPVLYLLFREPRDGFGNPANLLINCYKCATGIVKRYRDCSPQDQNEIAEYFEKIEENSDLDMVKFCPDCKTVYDRCSALNYGLASSGTRNWFAQCKSCGSYTAQSDLNADSIKCEKCGALFKWSALGPKKFKYFARIG
jgi:hypothetical protein